MNARQRQEQLELERSARRVFEVIRIIKAHHFKPEEAFGPPRQSDGHRLFIGGGWVSPLQYTTIM